MSKLEHDAEHAAREVVQPAQPPSAVKSAPMGALGPSTVTQSARNMSNAQSADWSQAEIDLLIRLKSAGLTTSQIVEKFREDGFLRAPGAIAVKTSRMRVEGLIQTSITDAPLKERRCLCCRKSFTPDAKTIYICSPCKAGDEFSIAGEYFVLTS